MNNYKPVEEELLVRPISRKISSALKRFTWATPNKITVLRFILAVTLVPFLILKQSFVLAGISVYFIFVLDKLDGDLARAKKMESSKGAYLDSIFDFISWFAWIVFIALAVHMTNIALLALAIFGPLFYWFNYFAKLVYSDKKAKPIKNNLLNVLKYNSAKHHLFTSLVLIFSWFQLYFYALALLNVYVFFLFLINLRSVK